MAKKFNLKKDPELESESKRYANPIASRQFIMEFMKHYAAPLSLSAIKKQFKIRSTSEQDAFEKRIKAMLRDGQIMQDRKDNLILATGLKLLTSQVSHSKELGFFVTTDRGKQIPLQQRFNNILFSGDRILAKVLPKSNHGPECAILVDVIVRRHTKVTGLYKKRNGIGFIEPSSKAFKADVLVASESKTANVGEYVIAEICHYPEVKQPYCIATITEILGDSSVKGVELSVALSAHDIPHEWPDAIYPEIANLKHKISAADLKNRTDLRHKPFVTIDGEDSRDFDDAVYAEKLENDNYKLYVAIADVSHYVRPGTELDKEARNRATSVYFPREVVPMLPEALSNDLCSLVPYKDRLAMVSEMVVNNQGELLSFDFYRAVINSHARLTYNKVFQMLEGSLKTPQFFQEPLTNLHFLYNILCRRRKERGAIEFNSPEARLIFNKEGKIAKIVSSSRNKAHMLIEECMLLANNAAALYLSQHETPSLFRVHGRPDAAKVKQLSSFLGNLGINLRLGKEISSDDYNAITKLVQGKSYEHIVNVVLLRTMQQAVYQPENIGHYGLNYDYYLHFTSPIRRYPDLIVHRCIASIIDKKQHAYSYKKLDELGEHCSNAERRADYASRDVVAWLKCCYMQDKLGVCYSGTITSVTSFGLFVEIDDIFVDGLVHISSLGNDYYDYKPDSNSLIGRKNNQKFSIGNKIKVKVAKVDVNSKFIDFEPIF